MVITQADADFCWDSVAFGFRMRFPKGSVTSQSGILGIVSLSCAFCLETMSNTVLASGSLLKKSLIQWICQSHAGAEGSVLCFGLWM